LDIPSKGSKVSLRQNAASIKSQLGVQDPEVEELLEKSVPPKGFEYLIEIFFTLRKGKGLEWTDIQAYCNVMKRDFSDFEIRALLAMDNEVSAYIQEKLES
jgi:hypothetical protein